MKNNFQSTSRKVKGIKSNQAIVNTKYFGSINWAKKIRHTNYFKEQMKEKQKKQDAYYLPILSWRFQNMMKIKVRELKEKIAAEEKHE